MPATFEFVRGPARERSAIDLFDRDAHFAVIRPGTDRVGAAHLFPVHHRSQRQILARREAIIVLEFIGDRKAQRDRVARFTTQILDSQAMKARH
jgi:hypothetical protein